MAKCKKCGKKGLFLKLSAQKLCSVCQIQEDGAERLLRIENNHEENVRNLESRAKEWSSRCDKAESEYKAVCLKLDAAKSELQHEQDKCAQLRSLAKSIKSAMLVISQDQAAIIAPDEVEKWSQMDIESILPEADLNCLTAKDLASKYKKVRKQIAEVCKAYEERYTTKTIAALYKLMVLALESEFENILYKLQFGMLEAGIEAVKNLTTKYFVIATEGNQSIAPTLKRFIIQIENLYLDALNIEYEYYVQRERAKEEQRAIKEQMRQEAEERKRLEQDRKKIEAEESKYQIEIDRITSQMQQAHDAELETLRKRLEEMNALMEKVVEKKEEIINLQNGKAGTVYVISNIGSFGDHVFKIGMTRRSDPQDRVNELGDASVPFPFDVHSFIFSQDAVALETALHHELNDRRVNKVNLRKEFFDVSIEELQAMVERIDPTAPFRVTALAEQYRQSLSIAAEK